MALNQVTQTNGWGSTKVSVSEQLDTEVWLFFQKITETSEWIEGNFNVATTSKRRAANGKCQRKCELFPDAIYFGLAVTCHL